MIEKLSIKTYVAVNLRYLTTKVRSSKSLRLKNIIYCSTFYFLMFNPIFSGRWVPSTITVNGMFVLNTIINFFPVISGPIDFNWSGHMNLFLFMNLIFIFHTLWLKEYWFICGTVGATDSVLKRKKCIPNQFTSKKYLNLTVWAYTWNWSINWCRFYLSFYGCKFNKTQTFESLSLIISPNLTICRKSIRIPSNQLFWNTLKWLEIA